MIWNYLKIALRNLHRHSGYSLINILGLAIGMACCMLILLFVQDELSYDKHHPHAERIYRVIDRTSASTPPALAPALENDFPEIENYARFKPPFGVWMMRYEDRVFYEGSVYWTDASVFDVFSFPLIQGDPRTALQAPNSVVLTESMARKYFGTENPMGKTLAADDGVLNVTVTGIMQDIPGNTHFSPDFFFSIATMPTFYNARVLESWDDNIFYTYVRLAPDASPGALEQKLPTFINKYVRQQENAGTITLTPSLQPLTDIHLFSQLENELGVNSDVAYIYILSSVALFMLLIACINFMNIATARSAGRAREVGLRKVVGADRFQLIRQFLSESILISLFSLFLAVALVQLTMPLFNAFTEKELNLAFDEGMLFLGLAGITLFVGVVSGSYPAFFLSSFQPGVVLKESVKTGGPHVVLRKALVVIQFSISTILIIGTGVVYDQLDFVRNKRLGFDKDHVITVPAAIQPIYERYGSLKSSLLMNASIAGVSRSSTLPGRPGGMGILPSIQVTPEGSTTGELVEIQSMQGDKDIVETIGLEIIAGRNFRTEVDNGADDSSIIINEMAVNLLGWGTSEEAVGKKIRTTVGEGTVIGVIKNFHLRSLHSRIEPLVLSSGEGNHISIRLHAGDINATMNFIKNTWQEVFADYPLVYSFLDEDFEKLYRVENKLSDLFGVFSLLTVFIACLGLLGLASFTAEQRFKEIGIRKVLGASISNVVVLLSKEVVILILLSNIIAWPMAYFFMDSWLQNFAYRVDMGVSTFVIGSLLTLFIALLTVSYQSISAASINPVKSLQYK